MPKYFCLLIVPLIAYSNVAFSQIGKQNCDSHYYQQTIGQPGESTNPKIIDLPGGDVVLSFIANNTLELSKFNAAGNNIWNKKYTISNGTVSGYIKGLKDADGNMLFMFSNDSTFFIKTDTAGNLLWIKNIHPFNNAIFSCWDMAIASNGDKIILCSTGLATIYRFDKDMNKILWATSLKKEDFFSNLLIDGNYVLLGSNYPEDGYDIFNSNGFIMKLNASTGAVLKFKYFKLPNTHGYISQIVKCGNDYVANFWANDYDSLYGKYAYLRLDGQLNIKAMQRITNYGSFDNDKLFYFYGNADGSFYAAYGESFDLSLALISANDIIKWRKNMPGHYSYPTDMQTDDEHNLYIAGNQNYFAVGPNVDGTYTYVIKSDLAGNVGECTPETTPSINLTPAQFLSGDTTVNISVDSVFQNDFTGYVSNLSPDISTYCATTSTCNSLHLSGNTSTCSTLPLFIRAKKNAGCTNPVNWVLPAAGVQASYPDDTTLSLSFTASGTYHVKAFLLLECGDTIRDSITIHANISGNVFLGRDTFLCSNNHLTLHAGNQFASYKWQDGSADSVYMVTVPGTYYVTVKDFCGSFYSDTIHINSKPGFTFHAGNDTSKCNRDTITLMATGGFINYTWQPSYNISADTGMVVKVFPDATTSYIAAAESVTGCIVSDTVTITVHHSPVINLGSDTSICSGQYITLTAGNNFTAYQWNTGAVSTSIQVNSAGTYSVQAKDVNGCTSADTVVVQHVYPLPSFTLGNDTTLCDKQSLEYSFNLPGASYLWSDGTMQPGKTLSADGTYWLTITQQGCFSSDTVRISYKPLPAIYLGADTSLCEGITKTLSAGNPGATYLWQDKSSNADYVVSQSGIYYVSINLNNCISSDTIVITYKLKPIITFDNNTYFCTGGQLTLAPDVKYADTYLWQDNSKLATFVATQGGIYTLTANNECGTDASSIIITQGVCQLLMPNAFTPNNDGLNDLFQVKYPEFVTTFYMAVYNRFGQQVFETTDAKHGWDGRYQGLDQPVGIYTWIIHLKDITGKAQNLKGIVSLLR